MFGLYLFESQEVLKDIGHFGLGLDFEDYFLDFSLRLAGFPHHHDSYLVHSER